MPRLWEVYSVWTRNFKVYRKTWKVNCLPPISEPIVYLIAFGLGLSPLIGAVQYNGIQLSYLEFIAPAMIGVGVLFQSFFESAFGSYFRLHYQQTWTAMLTAPLSIKEVFIGDWLWASTKGVFSGGATAIIAVLWGIYPLEALPWAMFLVVLGSLMFAGLGLCATGFVKSVEQFNIPIFMIVVPMFVLSGTYFPKDNLPFYLAKIVEYLPLSPLVELLRMPQGSFLEIGFNLLVLSLWLLGLTTLAYKKIVPKLVS